MTKNIILFGAGKSATHLIKFLIAECAVNDWRLTVADNDLALALSKVGISDYANAKQILVDNADERSDLIKEADLVISLLPPALHILVASDCVRFGKDLLTASYMDDNILSLSKQVKSNGLLFICEMGLDPGIDHMSALSLIHKIKNQGGKIVSFKSHCGGLVSPESDNNPWHYKVSWNPKNIVRAGSSGAIFKENNLVHKVSHEQLFANCKTVSIAGLGELAYYPNRDSLSYLTLYKMEDTPTFIRTTLRHPDYCPAWNAIVNAGLSDDTVHVTVGDLTFKKWSSALLLPENVIYQNQFEYLGLFDKSIIPDHLKTSSDILQYLLEKKLMMQPYDKDMVVMLHEIEYLLEGILYKNKTAS